MPVAADGQTDSSSTSCQLADGGGGTFELGRSWKSRQRRPDDGPNNARSNPCYLEAQQSMKCLQNNGYDRDKCEKYFDNYKECKKFWNSVRDVRAKNGIKPAMPPHEEREAIKKHYKETGTFLA